MSERWYSPQLQAVVLSRHSDPRFGETTYRLTNIVRAEPEAAAFAVPADFTVKDAPDGELVKILREQAEGLGALPAGPREAGALVLRGPPRVAALRRGR